MWTPLSVLHPLGCGPVLPLCLLPPGFMASAFREGLPRAGLLLVSTPGRGLLAAFPSQPSSPSEEALTQLRAGPGTGLDVPGPRHLQREASRPCLAPTSLSQAHICPLTSCVPRRGHDRAGMGRPLLQPQARWGGGDSREVALSSLGPARCGTTGGHLLTRAQPSRAGVLPSVSFLPPALRWPPHTVQYPRHEGAPQRLSFLLF